MAGKWLDITVPMASGMVHWPGDAEVSIRRTSDMRKGTHNNVSLLHMGSHTGTHMDAPLHFIRNGRPLDKMPLEAVIGPCRIIEVKDKKSIKPEVLKQANIKKGERIIFKTSNSKKRWGHLPFNRKFIFIEPSAAEFLVNAGISTVGIDYLSVGEFNNGVSSHQMLLGAGIWLIEGLDLHKVRPGNYDLICLPLRIIGSDGSPSRALIRPT